MTVRSDRSARRKCDGGLAGVRSRLLAKVLVCGGVALSVGIAVGASGCKASGAAGETETDPGTGADETFVPPDRASFPLVLGSMERRCATLDCHGDPGRNLRLYTGSGLRLDPKDISGMGATTPGEEEASYWSLVGLEPEETSLVVAQEGEHPERLTFIRKARGTEYHKPGAIIERGDEPDTCFTSWLASKTDEEACKKAAELVPPEPK